MPTHAGPVPRMTREPESAGPVKEIAAIALLVALAADAGPDDRLALALGIEGLLSWFRESDRGVPHPERAGLRARPRGRPAP